jgi:hypothetical protein
MILPSCSKIVLHEVYLLKMLQEELEIIILQTKSAKMVEFDHISHEFQLFAAGAH